MRCTVLLMLDYQVRCQQQQLLGLQCLLSRVCGHIPISSFCAILFKPPQFKLDPRLARLLGIHTQTRPVIIQALWQYIKTHKLQDPHEREYVICDKYLQQVMVAGAASAFLCEQPGIPGTELSAEPHVSGTDI